MTLSWNLVTKHLHPHQQLQAKIWQKISKLEVHLQHFPPDTVHLLVHLERHPKREDFTVALTLRLPSNILHSHKTALDPVPAFDKAVKALLRELAGLKAELRRDAERKRAQTRAARWPLPAARFAPTPAPTGPQSLAETLAVMIQRYHGRLLYHVQRHLWRAHLAGTVAKGAINAVAVVDEVVQQALAAPQRKPEEMSYRFWLFALARQELRRRVRQLRTAARESLSLDEAESPPDKSPSAEGYDAENPLEIIEDNLEPTVAPRASELPDPQAAPPDSVAMEKDLVEYLQRVAAAWPERERAVFDLHFLEGFEADEVAMLENLKVTEARELIAGVQVRLRHALHDATDRWVTRAK